MAVMFICFQVAEHVVIGLIQGETVTASVPVIGGEGLAGPITVAVIFSVGMIAFFAFRPLVVSWIRPAEKSDAVRNRHQVRGSRASNLRGGWLWLMRPLVCSVSGSGAL